MQQSNGSPIGQRYSCLKNRIFTLNSQLSDSKHRFFRTPKNLQSRFCDTLAKSLFREPITLNRKPSFEGYTNQISKTKGMIKIARKYKQVKRKELTFDLPDWEKIERRAEACHTDTTKYLRRMILDREPIFYDMKNVAPMINGMRTISRNINQIAKKANETNTLNAEDYEKLRKEVQELFRTVNLSLSTLLSRKV